MTQTKIVSHLSPSHRQPYLRTPLLHHHAQPAHRIALRMGTDAFSLTTEDLQLARTEVLAVLQQRMVL